MSDITKPKGLLVEIKDDSTGELYESFTIKPRTVATAARRFKLYTQIKEKNLPDDVSNQLMYCANLATVLCDKDGNALFPEPTEDGVEDNGYMELYEEYDESVFMLLVEAYNEVNPVERTLTAKKKKF